MVQTRRQKTGPIVAPTAAVVVTTATVANSEPQRKITKKEEQVLAKERAQEFAKKDKARVEQAKAKKQGDVQQQVNDKLKQKLTKQEERVLSKERAQEFAKRDKARIEQAKGKKQGDIQQRLHDEPKQKLTKKEKRILAKEKAQEFAKRDKARIEEAKKKGAVQKLVDEDEDNNDDDESHGTNLPKKKRKENQTSGRLNFLEERKENSSNNSMVSTTRQDKARLNLANVTSTSQAASTQSLTPSLAMASLSLATNASGSSDPQNKNLNKSNPNRTKKKNDALYTGVGCLTSRKSEEIGTDDDKKNGNSHRKIEEIEIDEDSDEDRKLPAKSSLSGIIPRSSRKRRRVERQAKSAQKLLQKSDLVLAQKLQKKEEESLKREVQAEQDAMTGNKSGKAVLVVQRVIKLVKDLKKENSMYADDINEVAIDDMVYMAERLLEAQQDFVDKNIPSYVDVGFHYTSPNNMEAIRENGLLTKSERSHRNVQSVNNHGSVFGEGVYTGNNPIAWSNYGSLGLVVARLQGSNIRVPFDLSCHNNFQVNANVKCVIGNKITDAMKVNFTMDKDGWPTNDFHREVVLRSSSQVLPMVKYNKSVIDTSKGRECIKQFESSLQNILDDLFNKGHKRAPIGSIIGNKSRYIPKKIMESLSPSSVATFRESYMARTGNDINNNTSGSRYTQQSGSNAGNMSFYYIPFADATSAALYLQQHRSLNSTAVTTGVSSNTLTSANIGGNNTKLKKQPLNNVRKNVPFSTSNNVGRNTKLYYQAPNNITTGMPHALVVVKLFKPDDECLICQDALLSSSGPCVKLAVCDHAFHRSCIERAFEVKTQCPICRKIVGKPQGKSPSGSMTISYTALSCSGYMSDSTIVITYAMHDGTQKSYHENPGEKHGGKQTTAYVPNNNDGKNLLKRLKYAFMHGLMFTVGTSLTTGITNQCTWSDIHHKTSLNGGASSHGFPDAGYFMNSNEELDDSKVPPADSLLDDGQ